jgi:ribosome maturation protein SDO1
MQVGALERNHQLHSLQRDMVNIVAEKTVNPETQRPYPVSMIEKVVQDNLHYSVTTQKSAKQQVRLTA